MNGSDAPLFGTAETREPAPRRETWKVMIVDDDDEVHHITKLVLSGFSFGGRKLEFISAYSGEEARAILPGLSDLAVILLDVVMEGEDSGLRLVRHIREELRNPFVRIILRTGQPGRAPESKVIIDYDINDYKEKTELTAQKLSTSLVAAIRAYRDIMTIERNRNGLEKIIEASAHIFELQSLKKFASGVLEQLTGILNLDRDAVYLGTGGFTAAREGEAFVALAATGRFAAGVGQRLDAFLGEKAMARVNDALATRSSSWRESVYVGYIETKTGSQNIIYLEDCPELSSLDTELINVYSMNVAIAFENIYLNREIEETHRELIFTLGDIIERRSRETGRHVQRVSEYARLLATLAGSSEEDADLVSVASAVHDIGKVAIPDVILNKPSALDPGELEVMRRHAGLGSEMLSFSKRELFSCAARIASEHHERWDGSGYPRGLAGEAIDQSARITSIADVFDALTSDRVYRQAWSVEKAVEYIRENAGRIFDPALCDIFIRNLDSFLEIRNRLP